MVVVVFIPYACIWSSLTILFTLCAPFRSSRSAQESSHYTLSIAHSTDDVLAQNSRLQNSSKMMQLFVLCCIVFIELRELYVFRKYFQLHVKGLRLFRSVGIGAISNYGLWSLPSTLFLAWFVKTQLKLDKTRWKFLHLVLLHKFIPEHILNWTKSQTGRSLLTTVNIVPFGMQLNRFRNSCFYLAVLGRPQQQR